MIDQYIYLGIGIVLGIAISIYFFASREEKIETKIKSNQKIYSTDKLDITMQKVVEKIDSTIKRKKRDLTEEEKNEIIIECYKENFDIYAESLQQFSSNS